MSTLTLLGFAMPGFWELVVIGGIVLLLFGHRLPSVMRSLGRGVVEFKKGVNDIDDDVDVAEKNRNSSGGPRQDPVHFDG